jgi:hypothetical protein
MVYNYIEHYWRLILIYILYNVMVVAPVHNPLRLLLCEDWLRFAPAAKRACISGRTFSAEQKNQAVRLSDSSSQSRSLRSKEEKWSAINADQAIFAAGFTQRASSF